MNRNIKVLPKVRIILIYTWWVDFEVSYRLVLGLEIGTGIKFRVKI